MYTLLLVDDEPIIRRGIKSLANLAALDIGEVLEAADAEQAKALLEKKRADIVMLDINMPGMDGLRFAEMLKCRYPLTAVIMLTGYDYFEYMQTAIRIGVEDYLLKPVSRTDIELVLKRICRKLSERNLKHALQKSNDSSAVAPPASDSFAQVDAYIQARLFEPCLSLAQAAEDLGFNASYLSGIIKQLYGIPFQEYIGLRRMEQAKRLLLSGNMKNYEVALAVGYEDVNYFITKFKKTYQLTPKQFVQGARYHED